MAYEHFLEAFAREQGVPSVDSLLADHAQKYSFQISSRDRAKAALSLLTDKLNIDWNGLKVLDVGCAYGAFTIELAKAGAKPVGIDINDKWLRLAEINAQDEAAVPFLNCDASTMTARSLLEQYGPFDVVLVNDVFEHIYDTTGLLSNIRALLSSKGLVYFKIPNGLATRHVLLEGHKKVFGISLLAPDYWSKFVKAPFHIYYRRWQYFSALFQEFGFDNVQLINENRDESHEQTQRHIQNDLRKIRRHLIADNFESTDQFRTVRVACKYYFDEVNEDLENMEWNELYRKYRVTFWEGIMGPRAVQ